MCNFDRVAGFLIAAKVAYLAMLALLITAAVLSGGVFSAGAAVAPMVGACVACGVATGFFIAALADINNCKGPCDSQLAEVNAFLVATIAAMAIVLGLLIALTIVAPVPVAGAVAITGAMVYLTMGAGVLLTVEALIAGRLAFAIAAFNSCQAANNRSSNSVLVTWFGILTGVGIAAGLTVGLASGIIWSAIALVIGGIALGYEVSVDVNYGGGTGNGPPNP